MSAAVEKATAPATAPGRCHPHPARLVEFLRRPEHDCHYVWRNAEMVKRDFPGSTDELLPQLRALYREKYKAEMAKLRKMRGY